MGNSRSREEESYADHELDEEASQPDEYQYEEPRDNSCNYRALTDPMEIDEKINQAESREDQYKLEEDAYTFALLQMLRPNSDNLKPFRVIFSLTLMLLCVSAQFCLLKVIWDKSAEKIVNNTEDYFDSVMRPSQLALNMVATRIDPGRADQICGHYYKEEAKIDGEKTVEDVFIYTTPNTWLKSPSKWNTDGMSKLHAAVYGLYVLDDFKEFASFVFLIAMAAWTGTMLMEASSIWNFAFKFLTLKCGGVRVRAPESFSGSDASDNGSNIIVTGINSGVIVLVLLIVALRLGIAIPLFLAGCRFLQTSLEVFDLVLNAVALGFVLEVDSLAYKSVKICSRDLLRNSLAIKIENVRWVSFENTLAYLCSFLILIIVTISALINYHILHADLVHKFEAWSTACLFLGPPPNIGQQFNVSFPVPGFCESILCIDVTKASIMCAQHAMPETGKVSPWALKLRDQCSQMLQLQPQTKYSVTNSSQVGKLGTREADQDLAGAKITDDAANFWCPTVIVENLVFGSNAEWSQTSYKALNSFWNQKADCQLELTADAERIQRIF